MLLLIDVAPRQNMLDVTQDLIEMAVRGGFVKRDYKLIGHRQVRPTKSPGDALYKIIQKWPHYTRTRDLPKN